MRPSRRLLAGIAYCIPVCSLVLALCNFVGHQSSPVQAGAAASTKLPALGREALTIVGLPGRGDGHGRGHHHRRPTATATLAAPTRTATSTATRTATSVATNTAVPGASATQPALPSATATAANTITATPVLPPVTATLPASTATVPAATATVAPVSTATATHVPATATQVPATATALATGTASATATATVLATGHPVVWLTVFENHGLSQIQGNASAPYFNSLFTRSDASYATNYNTLPGQHPSLPSYLALESGQCWNFCGTDNNPSPPINSTAHLTALLNAAGISWKSYQEDISAGTCPVNSTGNYVPRHNGTIYFSDVQGNTAYCVAHERAFSDMAGDLASGNVAAYNFVTPSLCHDMHSNSCPGNGDVVAQGDTWLKNNLPTILDSAAYRNGGVVFILFDEGSGNSDGPLPMIVLSSRAKGHGYHNGAYYTHASTLRTLEEMFGVSPLLGAAANATNLSDLFK